MSCTHTHTHFQFSSHTLHKQVVSQSTSSNTEQAQAPLKTRARTARVAGRPARRRTACRVAGAADSCTAKQRPEAPSGTDNADHCRQPRLDRRESSARAAGRARKVAGAGSRKARALTAAQPEASSAAPQQPRRRSRGPIRSRRPSRSRAARDCAARSPLCALHRSHSTRITSTGRGWQALQRVVAEYHPSCAATHALAHCGGSMHWGARPGGARVPSGHFCAHVRSRVALELLGAQWLLRTTRDRPAEQREALLCPWGVHR